jgi:threonine aldolase
MRQAIASAEVGDDLLDGDPTTRRLQDRVAALLGKESALFFPTGTMANQAAVWIQAARGTEILTDPDSHLVRREVAACAALCGVQPRSIVALRADQPAAEVEAVVEREITAPSPSRVSLVCLENTHNGAGGVVLSLEATRGAAQAARRHGVPVHLDGARVWNAAVALGIAPSELAAPADTVTVCFDKGLGAPGGSVLAGPATLIDAARPARRRFGGTMRQNGILSAAALYGLDHHMGDLARDHEHARTLARALGGISGVTVVAPQTNILMLELTPPRNAVEIARRAKDAGVLAIAWTATRLRLTTHRDIDATAIETAGAVLRKILSGTTGGR